MAKMIKFEASINEIVEFMLTENERLRLVDYILYELTSNKKLEHFSKRFIKDYNESKNLTI